MNECYTDVMEQLLKAPQVRNTRELLNTIIEIDNPSLENMHFHLRPFSEKYANSELEWYWTADNSCHTIGKAAKRWLSITDDGETSNSAYGYILAKKYNKSQIDEVIELLKQDPLSRRAVLNISDPSIDRIHTKDMQCTVCVQLLLRDNKLHEFVYMRSNDIFYGFPYDYIYFITLQQYIASKLGVECGSYTHHAGSMHLYDSSLEKLREADDYYTINPEKYFKMYEEVMSNEK